MMDLIELISQIRETLGIVQTQNASVELIKLQNESTLSPNKKLIGILPPLYPEWLGDKNFLQTHQVRFPYIVGEMANGIATAKMVVAAAKAGMLGFFGAAGLMPEVVES